MSKTRGHASLLVRRLRCRVTYANVAATLAVVLATAGTSYAAFILPANSVGNRQLQPGAVSATKIRSGAIGGHQVRAYSLTGRNIDKRKLGRVPSAVHASNATSANRAKDAQTLDGLTAGALKVRCPTGTTLNAGGCIELAAHPSASFTNAATQCAERRLPTPAELESLRQRATPPSGAAIELTSDLADQANLITVDMTTGATGTSSVSTSLPFRCVALPVN